MSAPANRAAAASEANSEGGEEEEVSHLSAPIYLGPPIRVSVGVPSASAEVITTAAAVRLPRPRPTLPTDPPGVGTANAFAPEGGPSAPIDAINSAAGAAAPLSDAPAN